MWCIDFCNYDIFVYLNIILVFFKKDGIVNFIRKNIFFFYEVCIVRNLYL